MNSSQRFRLFDPIDRCLSILSELTEMINCAFLFKVSVFPTNYSLLVYDCILYLSIKRFRVLGFHGKSRGFFNVLHQNQVNDAETVYQLFYLLVNEVYAQFSENWLGLCEDIV
jgi:hypothetical protein